MSRYAAMFDRLGREGAFGAFLMLGDPDLQTSARLLDEAVEAGADMIEVGIPFSDPIADGPVIQAAAQRALAAGVRVGDCLDLIAALRARHSGVPIGILTYANIVVARSGFIRDAADAGADSLLIADLPALEAAAVHARDGTGGDRARAHRRRKHAGLNSEAYRKPFKSLHLLREPSRHYRHSCRRPVRFTAD